MKNDLQLDSKNKLKQITHIEDNVIRGIKNVLKDESVLKYLPFSTSPEDAEIRSFLNQIINERNYVWAIYCNSEIIGIIDLINIENNTANLAYFLGKSYWGKGIISKSINLVTKYSFENLNLLNVIAPVVSRNKASICVLEKNNFIFQKRTGRQVNFDGKDDEVLFYILKKTL